MSSEQVTHTPTPWKVFVGEHSDVVEILDGDGVPVVGWPGFDDSRRSPEEHEANAKFIVEACNRAALEEQGPISD